MTFLHINSYTSVDHISSYFNVFKLTHQQIRKNRFKLDICHFLPFVVFGEMFVGKRQPNSASRQSTSRQRSCHTFRLSSDQVCAKKLMSQCVCCLNDYRSKSQRLLKHRNPIKCCAFVTFEGRRNLFFLPSLDALKQKVVK